MADPQQVELIRKGAAEWNKWRTENDSIQIDLSGADLTGADLIGANLLKAEAVLEEAALDRYTFLRDAWLQRRRNQVYDGKPPLEEDFDEPPAEAKPQEKK